MKFRKKPVVVEAVMFNGVWPDGSVRWAGAPQWLIDATQKQPDANGAISVTREPGVWANIVTLEGVMKADVGDWIIRGVKGELYPCKPDIFEATYEPA